MATNHLFVIDDEPDLALFISRVAAGCGYEVSLGTDASQVRRELTSSKATHIILDLRMPGVDGIEVLRHLAETKSRAKIIILSGSEPKVLEAARRFGTESGLDIVGTLHKPIRAVDLRDTLTRLKEEAAWPSAADLAKAIQEGELFLEYQPRVLLPSRALTGVEALVRWRHPDRGIVPPAQFLSVQSDEALGLITSFVATTALTQIAAWRDQGLELALSLNLSGRSLSAPSFAETIAAECQRFGVAPEQVTLELTEVAAVESDAHAVDVLARLRLKDFRLSIDDFGTGAATLVQLYRLPFCEVKIDGSFIRECEQSRNAQVIVRAMIDLAHNLDLTACAEGVESAGGLELLQELGCNTAQGHHIARPMAAEFMPAWARAQQRRSAEAIRTEVRQTG